MCPFRVVFSCANRDRSPYPKTPPPSPRSRARITAAAPVGGESRSFADIAVVAQHLEVVGIEGEFGMGGAGVDVVDMKRGCIDHAAAFAGQHAIVGTVGLQGFDPELSPLIGTIKAVCRFRLVLP